MNVFGTIGIALMALGFAAEAALLVEPFHILPEQVLASSGAYASLWIFFVFFVVVGFALFSFSPSGGKQATDTALVVVGSLLLVTGFFAALGLFLSTTGLVTASGTWSWWLLFLGGIAVGALAVLMGNRAAKD